MHYWWFDANWHHGICNQVVGLKINANLSQSLSLMSIHTQLDCPHLTHWGRVTHKCVSKFSIIGSDNGLSPSRRQSIIWTNAGILLTEPLGTNFSEILIKIHTFSFKKMHLKHRLKKAAILSRPQCVNTQMPGDAYKCQWIRSSSVQVIVCRQFGFEQVAKPIMTCCQLDSWGL